MAISSRRQYVQVSNAIRKHYPINQFSPNFVRDKQQWDRFIETLIEDYSKDNLSFDAIRFRKDCLPNGHSS
jgi:hypothetical protein